MPFTLELSLNSAINVALWLVNDHFGFVLLLLGSTVGVTLLSWVIRLLEGWNPLE